MKKVISIVLTILLLLSITINSYAAISFQMELTVPKSEYQSGEEFVVEAKISSLQADKGIIAFGAKLEYDKNTLTLVGMQGQNGWETPSEDSNTYNPETGKIAITRSGAGKQSEAVFKITFKAKSNNVSISSIALKDISVADGTTLQNTSDAYAKAVSNSNESTPTPTTNSTPATTPSTNDTPKPSNMPTSNSTKKPTSNGTDNSVTTNTKLPQTGESHNEVFLILAVAIAITTTISSIIYKKKSK